LKHRNEIAAHETFASLRKFSRNAKMHSRNF
jgi:hypothetical protein